MGDSLVQTKQAEHISLTEIFEKECPFFISIGMTYEQFWYGDATMTRAYLKAYKLKEKRNAIKEKWMNWELGLYIYEALCDVSPILRAFSKASKPLPFVEKPYNIEELCGEDEEKKKQEEEKQKELDEYKAEIFFKNWVNSTSKKFKKEE